MIRMQSFSGSLHDVLPTAMCVSENDGEKIGLTAQQGPWTSCGFIASDCHNVRNWMETIV
jgi:hypothetical protein